MAKIIMIGVSTAQNTTNVLPALQMKIDGYVSIETSLANKNGWSAGMELVLKNRGIEVYPPIVLNEDEGSRIDLLEKKLINYFSDDIEVLWNLGGGQKAQQFALWQSFITRGKDEIACYANPVSKKLEIWEYDNERESLDFSVDKLESDLSAEEIFKIYGFNLEMGSGGLFYPNTLKSLNNESFKLLDFKEFREFFFKVPQTSPVNPENSIELTWKHLDLLSKKINDDELRRYAKKEQYKSEIVGRFNVESIIPHLRKRIIRQLKDSFFNKEVVERIKIDNTTLKDFLHNVTGERLEFLDVNSKFFKKIFPSFKRASFLYEEMLREKVLEILTNHKNNIIEAYSNVILKNKEGSVVAEYDILLVTKWGTIISIDAKTFDIKVKDIDARLLKLRAGAGRYVNFVICYPFYSDDIEEKWYPIELRRLHVKLKENSIKYCMLNDDTNNKSVTFKDNKIDFITVINLFRNLDLIVE